MESCLIYFSSAPQLSPDQLDDILLQSRAKNEAAGISGALLFVRGQIIQVLEGESEAVMALYERIQRDPRHTHIELILNRPITTRTFDQWSMGYKTLGQQQLDEIRALVDLDQPEGLGSQPTDPILLRTLKLFYVSNQHG